MEDNIKMHLCETWCERVGLDSTGST